jgi:penicillin amidase
MRTKSLLLLTILTCVPAFGLAAPGKTIEVTVIRDERGVPHVYAATDAGAFYGLGYATARDRLAQMNLYVRAAQGRMAEIVGPSKVDDDRYFRILGFWRHAREVAKSLDGEHRKLLRAYADGVNDYVAELDGELPPLFAELGIEPEKWTPAHCVVTFWRFADFFMNDPTGKASDYYRFTDLAAELGVEAAVAEFLANHHPGDPEAGVVQAGDVPQDVQDAIHAYAASLGYGDPAKGIPAAGWADYHPRTYGHASPKFSHAWAVGGGRTTTGEAVLISDPQVPVTFPNLLYEWHVAGATFDMRGIGVAGSPGFLIGFNAHVAYGLTAAGLDQRDLVRLAMTGRDTYEVDGKEHRLERAREVIHVKGGHDVPVVWRRSLWGPVVTELIDDVRGDDEFALKGLPFSEDDRDTFEGMLAIQRATDLDALRAALDAWRLPSANLVAAGAAGSVFYTVIGAIPVRSVASPLAGLIAQEGTSLVYDWQDVIPGKYRPWVLDPAAGFVFSANHRPAGDWYPLSLGIGLLGGGDTVRSRRLRELLEGLPSPVSPAQVLAQTQYDCVNGARRDMVLVLRQAVKTGAQISADAGGALAALEPWSEEGGEVLTTSPGVFLATRISTKFRPDVNGSEFQEAYGGGEGGLSLFLKEQLRKIAADPAFEPGKEAVAYLDAVLAAAWRAAVAQEPDPSKWDDAYAAGAAVNPELTWFANAAALGDHFPGNFTYAPPTLQCGDGQTIWSQGGQTYTQFVDFAAIDESLAILPPGNAEGPGHFQTSQGSDWSAGVLGPAPLSAGAVGELEVETLVLTYGGG